VARVIRWKAAESVEWQAKARPKLEKIPILTAIRTDLKFFLVIFCSFAGQALFIYGSVTFLPSFFRLYTTISPIFPSGRRDPSSSMIATSVPHETPAEPRLGFLAACGTIVMMFTSVMA